MGGVAPSLSGNPCDPPYDGYVEGFSLAYGGTISGISEVIQGRRRPDEIFVIYVVEFEWVYDFRDGEWAVFLAASQTLETSLGISGSAAMYQGTIDGFGNYLDKGIGAYEGNVWNDGFNVGASFLNAWELGHTRWQANPANQYAENLGELRGTTVQHDKFKVDYSGYFASFGYSLGPLSAVFGPMFPKAVGPAGALFFGPGVAQQRRGPYDASSEQMANPIESGLDPESGIGTRPIIGGPLFNPKRREAAEVLRNYSW
jgi:hypothetical protein